jgi:hypothetical protein
MSKLIASQDNEKIVLVDGTIIEIDTGMFGDPLGFIVTDAAADGAESRPEIDFSDVGVGYDDDVPE